MKNPLLRNLRTELLNWRTLVVCAVLAGFFLPQTKNLAGKTGVVYASYLFACGFLLAFLLVPLAKSIGATLGFLDYPDSRRKRHTSPIPLTGGAAVYGAFALTILINYEYSIEMKAILVGSTIVFVVGLIDDRWGLSAKVRLLSQVLAAGFLIAFGVRVTFVPSHLGGVWVETLITLVWLIGITNSMNFIDGMDGLASGTSMIYAVFFAIIAVMTKQMYMMYLAAALAGSCLGFFPYNFRKGPALVFLGDSGSTFLGFLLASFAIMGEWGKSIVDLAVPVLIMSVLIFDMTLTTIVRVHSAEVRSFTQWLRYTGRDHFHHRLTGLGLGEKGAAWVFFSVSICFGLEALAVLFSDIWVALIILAHSIIVFAVIGIILVLRNSDTPASLDQRTAGGAHGG